MTAAIVGHDEKEKEVSLTASIVGHDEREQEVSLTFAWIVAFERKIGQFDRSDRGP